MAIPALDQRNLHEGVQSEEDPLSPEKIALFVREGSEQEPGWQRYSRYLGSEGNVTTREGLSVLPVSRTICVQDLRTRFQRALKRAAFSTPLNLDATFQLPDGGIVYRLSVSSDQSACIVWCDDASAEIRSKIERLFGPDAAVQELGGNVLLVEGGNVVATALPPSRMPPHREPIIVDAGQPVFDRPRERSPFAAPCTSKKQTFGGHMAQQGWGFRAIPNLQNPKVKPAEEQTVDLQLCIQKACDIAEKHGKMVADINNKGFTRVCFAIAQKHGLIDTVYFGAQRINEAQKFMLHQNSIVKIADGILQSFDPKKVSFVLEGLPHERVEAEPILKAISTPKPGYIENIEGLSRDMEINPDFCRIMFARFLEVYKRENPAMAFSQFANLCGQKRLLVRALASGKFSLDQFQGIVEEEQHSPTYLRNVLLPEWRKKFSASQIEKMEAAYVEETVEKRLADSNKQVVYDLNSMSKAGGCTILLLGGGHFSSTSRHDPVFNRLAGLSIETNLTNSTECDNLRVIVIEPKGLNCTL